MVRGEVSIHVRHGTSILFFPRAKDLAVTWMHCDRCQCPLDANFDLHYGLTIELEAGGLSDGSEVASTAEQWDSVEQLIESSDALCAADFGDDWYQRRQYTLCKGCFQQYIQNPLAKPSPTKPIGYQPG